MRKMTRSGAGHARPARLAAVLMVLMLALPYGYTATAEETSKLLTIPSGYTELWRLSTFSSDMPKDIAQALIDNGLVGYSCYAGAMLEQMATQRYTGSTSSLKTQALIAIEKGGKRVLVGMLWKGEAWGLSVLGEKALLPGREFTISASSSNTASRWYQPLRFTITYPLADGGSETYGIFINDSQAGDLPAWNPQFHLWQLNDYARVNEKGEGICIIGGNGAYQVISLPDSNPKIDNLYPAYVPTALEHLYSIADFPTSDDMARQVAEKTMAEFLDTNLALTFGGVNIRKYPTTSSDSLGKLRSGVLVELLGEEKGKDAPWYHVRLGQVEGFVSGVYIKLPGQDGFASTLSTDPLVKAKALDTITLRTSPEDGAQGIEFPKDTLMHVLLDVGQDWYYVSIPDSIGWKMDLDGAYGYVKVSEVQQGY